MLDPNTNIIKSQFKDILEYLEAINNKNEFDLCAKWAGYSYMPYLLVYKEADKHELCSISMISLIKGAGIDIIRKALPHWSLEDVDYKTV